MIKINNLPAFAKNNTWVVYTIVDGKAWFYDAWQADRQADAIWQALDIGGFVVNINLVVCD